MLQEIRDPFGIFGVGLSPWHRFDMLRIDHEHFDLTFKEMEHRFPIHSRSFQGHMTTVLGEQPLQQVQQFLRRCPIRPILFVILTIFSRDALTGRAETKILLYVLQAQSGSSHLGDIVWFLYSPRSVSLTGSLGAKKERPLGQCILPYSTLFPSAWCRQT